jgi:hypothetical protein
VNKTMGSQGRQPTIVPQPNGSPIPPGAAAVLLDMLRTNKPRNPVSSNQRPLSIFES